MQTNLQHISGEVERLTALLGDCLGRERRVLAGRVRRVEELAGAAAAGGEFVGFGEC